MITHLARLLIAAHLLAQPRFTGGEVGWLLANDGEGSEFVWRVAGWFGWCDPVAEVPYFRCRHADAADLADAHCGTLNALRMRIHPAMELVK